LTAKAWTLTQSSTLKGPARVRSARSRNCAAGTHLLNQRRDVITDFEEIKDHGGSDNHCGA